MNYQASISDFFKSPKWTMNLLLGAVAIMIPMIGPILLSGWHITVLWTKRETDDPAKAPPFDFQHFANYLERGLWPFLVSLVASLVLIPVIMALVFGAVLLAGTARHAFPGQEDAFPFILFTGISVIYLGVLAVFNLLVVPLVLRATITQDFKTAFDFRFIGEFLSCVWREFVVTLLFLLLLGVCLMIVTILTCYIGGFFAGPLFLYSWHHLQKQLYQLHLTRGGEAIPLSPKLSDRPPSWPTA